VFAKVAHRTRIFFVQKMADLLFAASGSTTKDIASMAINVLNGWCWLEKCIDR